MKKGNSYRNRFPDNNLQYIYWLVNVTISDVIFHYEFLANSNSTYLVSNTGYKCLDVQLCGTALLTGCISTFKTSAMLVTKIIFYRLSNTWEKSIYTITTTTTVLTAMKLNTYNICALCAVWGHYFL